MNLTKREIKQLLKYFLILESYKIINEMISNPKIIEGIIKDLEKEKK